MKPKRRPSGLPVSILARKALAKIADDFDLDAEADVRRDLQYPHLQFHGLKHMSLFSKVLVQTGRVYVRDRMQEVGAFAKLDGPNAIGVVLHQRDGDPYNAILRVEDFFRIVALAEEALALRALNARRKARR